MNSELQIDRATRQATHMGLIYDRGDRYVAANLLDISETGALLQGEEAAAVGKQVTLYADLNDQESWPIQIEGVVVRQSGDGRMGVRFVYASVAQLTQMRLFVQALVENPARLEASDKSDHASDAERKNDESAQPTKNKRAQEDEDEETSDGEPTFESLSDAERIEEIEGETEAAEGESLDTVDQHELSRAEAREEKAEEKAEELEDENKAEKKEDDKKPADKDAHKAQASAAANDAAFTIASAETIDASTPSGAETPRAHRAALSGVYGILDLEERYTSGAILDLSETGFFLTTNENVELGQDLVFMPHDTAEGDAVLPFELSARVVRIDDTLAGRPRGIACHIVNLSGAERDGLKRYVWNKIAH